MLRNLDIVAVAPVGNLVKVCCGYDLRTEKDGVRLISGLDAVQQFASAFNYKQPFLSTLL